MYCTNLLGMVSIVLWAVMKTLREAISMCSSDYLHSSHEQI